MLLLPIFKKKTPLKFIVAMSSTHSIWTWLSKGADNAGLMILQFLYFHFDAQFNKYL